MVVYGIGSCDTCRAARTALAAAGHEVAFRDIRARPLAAGKWAEFLSRFGAALVNRASASWRSLDAEAREAAPEVLLARHPALMKRPVIRDGAELHLGWTAAVQAALLR